MYSLVFLMYCNPMFILGCVVMYLIHVIPRCLFREVSIMTKSCKVIVGNPHIGQGLKSLQCRGTRLLDSPREVGPNRLLSSRELV